MGRERRRVKRRVSESEHELRRAAVERRAAYRELLKGVALWFGLAAGGGVLMYLLFRLIGR
jgi:hypothetical protein